MLSLCGSISTSSAFDRFAIRLDLLVGVEVICGVTWATAALVITNRRDGRLEELVFITGN